MANVIMCGILILILILGLFLKEVLGFLFAISVILFFLSTFNLCNHIMKPQERCNGLMFLDVVFKLVYYLLTALMFCCEYSQKQISVFVVCYLGLSVIDICFLRVKYNYYNYKLPSKCHITVSEMIGSMHMHYKKGYKDALFGKQTEKTKVRCLAWISIDYIVILVSIAFSTFVGNFHVYFGDKHIKIKSILDVVWGILVIVQSYFCWKALFGIPIKLWIKKCICLVSTIGLYIMFFSPIISISPNKSLASSYPFFCVFGIVMTGAVLYIMTLTARYYLWCINKKGSEKTYE